MDRLEFRTVRARTALAAMPPSTSSRRCDGRGAGAAGGVTSSRVGGNVCGAVWASTNRRQRRLEWRRRAAARHGCVRQPPRCRPSVSFQFTGRPLPVQFRSRHSRIVPEREQFRLVRQLNLTRVIQRCLCHSTSNTALRQGFSADGEVGSSQVVVVALVGAVGAARRRADLAADHRRDALRHPVARLADALPPPPAAIVITGKALPKPKAERVYTVERIDRRQIEQSPSHELDQLLKEVPGVQLFRRSDARSGHPTSQGVTLARARRQCFEPRTAGARRRASVGPVRRLGELARLRSGEPCRHSRRARRRQRRQRPGSARGDDRDDQPRAMPERRANSTGGAAIRSRRALARAIEPAAACSACPAGSSAATASFRSRAETRGPADKRAPYDEWSGRARWVAPLAAIDRTSGERVCRFMTGGRAAPSSARTEPTAPTRRCGWSDAANGSGAPSVIGSGAT